MGQRCLGLYATICAIIGSGLPLIVAFKSEWVYQTLSSWRGVAGLISVGIVCGIVLWALIPLLEVLLRKHLSAR